MPGPTKPSTQFGTAFGALGLPTTSPGNPGTGPDGINRGELQPNQRAANAEAGVRYQLLPAYPPFVRLAAPDQGVVYFPRFYTAVFGGSGEAAAVQPGQGLTFTYPTIILARTGGAFLADDADAPIGRAGLELFKVRMFRAGSAADAIDAGFDDPTVLALAVNLLGTAAQPALIPGNGVFFDTGSKLSVQVETLIANVEAHVTIWCLEEFGQSRG